MNLIEAVSKYPLSAKVDVVKNNRNIFVHEWRNYEKDEVKDITEKVEGKVLHVIIKL